MGSLIVRRFCKRKEEIGNLGGGLITSIQLLLYVPSMEKCLTFFGFLNT